MSTQGLQIFDTTLRDGDQGTGTPFTRKEKILVAQMLAKAGVDVIEAGFARSRVDGESIKAVVDQIGKDENSPTIASLSRGSFEDIDASHSALEGATRPRIHTFIATSEAHMRYKLNMTRTKVLENIRTSVGYAASTGYEVQWSAEDATNSERKFLLEAVREAIEAGATIINIPDTLGGSDPWTVRSLFAYLRAHTQNLRDAGKEFIFSSHAHNDNGGATMNTIAAVKGGARQLETTILGIGERTGNAKFHEVVAFLEENGKGNIIRGIDFVTGIRKELVFPVSYLVSRIIGRDISANEPIIGSRANSHGSGIHVHGNVVGKRRMSQDAEKTGRKSDGTDIYSIIDTSRYGAPGEVKTFNARSGATEVMEMLRSYGIDIPGKEAVDAIVTKSATMAENARGIFPTMILANYLTEQGRFRIDRIEVVDGRTISITLLIDGERKILEGKAKGENGIIDATVNAINGYLATKSSRRSITITDYSTVDRESPSELADDFGLEMPIDDDEEGRSSERIGISTFCISGNDGERHWSRHASHNVQDSEIRALVNGSIVSLMEK